jgi:DNA mismatch endonuclease (patch repair protein)
MRRQQRRDTVPELLVRRALHAAGRRYRIAFPVPGMPRRSIDIAFTRARVAVFVHGCFWHGCPTHGTSPKANEGWWRDKLQRNVARDAETEEHLRRLGWAVCIVWEHEDPASAVQRVEDLLREPRA